MSAKRQLTLAALIGLLSATVTLGQGLTPTEELGKQLFFDENLSTPPGQSCATCHAPETGFTGPISDINATLAIYPGVIHTRFGNRKPPTAAYGGDSPVLFEDGEGTWTGGMFWDGRATGDILGDPLAEQAQGPFLNPLEQNTPNARVVCLKVANSDYADLFEAVWGPVNFTDDVALTYERIALSISAYEKSKEVNPFSSKYDYYVAGAVDILSDEEAWGLELFEDPAKGNCAACHPDPLFTDFTYDNLGVPKNPLNPFYFMPKKWNPDGENWVDPGLGGFLGSIGEDYVTELGKHKVPTLRNVDKRPDETFVKAFGHNGYFKSLKDIVHFYNTRDVAEWPEPEVSINVNTDELGNLGLTDAEEDAIVAFLKTLSDGYILTP
jgi:cytochrome c peroxidase